MSNKRDDSTQGVAQTAREFAKQILPQCRSIEKQDRPRFWAALMTWMYAEMCDQVGSNGAETIMKTVISLEPMRRPANLKEIDTKKLQ